MGSTITSTRPGGGRIGRSILAASMSVAAIAASVIGAYFTDTDARAGNEFATGSVDLSLDSGTQPEGPGELVALLELCVGC